MTPRTDVVGLVVGLLACVLAGLGAWSALATVPWHQVALAAPVALVVIGLVGLFASRSRN